MAKAVPKIGIIGAKIQWTIDGYQITIYYDEGYAKHFIADTNEIHEKAKKWEQEFDEENTKLLQATRIVAERLTHLFYVLDDDAYKMTIQADESTGIARITYVLPKIKFVEKQD